MPQTAEQARELAWLVSTLTLEKHNVSASRRRHVSIPDSRGSAKLMGVIGIVMCALPVLFMLATDVLGVCARDTALHLGFPRLHQH